MKKHILGITIMSLLSFQVGLAMNTAKVNEFTNLVKAAVDGANSVVMSGMILNSAEVEVLASNAYDVYERAFVGDITPRKAASIVINLLEQRSIRDRAGLVARTGKREERGQGATLDQVAKILKQIREIVFVAFNL